MATASNSHPAPIQSQNSPRTPRLSFGSHDIPSLPDGSPPSLSTVADQQQFVNSPDSLLSKETSIRIAPASSVTEDGSALGGSVENYGSAKKPVWKKPSNNAIAEVGAVMGAESWPALSESARASPKASSTDSLKSLPHVSLPVSQVMSVSSFSPQKEITPNSPSNHVVPTRQRSLKLGGGNSGPNAMSAKASLSQAPSELLASPGKFGVESVHKNDHHQRGTFRRSSSGSLISHHNSHGGKRDQERGKQDWNNHNRAFGNKESHAPQQRGGSRPFIRGPPSANAPFIAPQQPPHLGMRPFVTPMIYTDFPSPVYYVSGPHQDPVRPMPMVPMTPVFFHMDPHLPAKIVNQIDYYFSNENLVRDTFLRQNMDSDGWVPITLIAGFKKVTQLTDNIQLILDVIQASNIVEVQGDKLRRKNDWMKWIIPTSPQPLHKPPSQDVLAEQLKSIALDEKAAT